MRCRTCNERVRTAPPMSGIIIMNPDGTRHFCKNKICEESKWRILDLKTIPMDVLREYERKINYSVQHPEEDVDYQESGRPQG